MFLGFGALFLVKHRVRHSSTQSVCYSQAVYITSFNWLAHSLRRPAQCELSSHMPRSTVTSTTKHTPHDMSTIKEAVDSRMSCGDGWWLMVNGFTDLWYMHAWCRYPLSFFCFFCHMRAWNGLQGPVLGDGWQEFLLVMWYIFIEWVGIEVKASRRIDCVDLNSCILLLLGIGTCAVEM